MSKRCELQKEYYQQYGNYKGNGKYCDKYVSWLENEVLALRQPLVSGSLQDIQEVIEFLQWAFRKVDKGDTPQETVRMLLMLRGKIDNIEFDSNDP